MKWATCGALGKIILVVYLFSMAWQLYMIQYPTECVHSRIVNRHWDENSKQNRQARDVAFNQYKEKCFMPHWDEDRKVNVSVYVGYTGPGEMPVWQSDGSVDVNVGFSANVTVPLPHDMTTETAVLKAWVFFRFAAYEYASRNDDRVGYSFALTRRRVPLSNGARVNLLESGGNATAVAPLLTPATAPADAREELHWRFARHPLVLRYGVLTRILNRATLSESGIKLGLRKRAHQDPRSYRKTDQVYNPVLWIDDLSITGRMYQPVAGLPDPGEEWTAEDGVGGEVEVEVGADGTVLLDKRPRLPGQEEEEAKAISDARKQRLIKAQRPPPTNTTFEFQFVPTSMLPLVMRKGVKAGMQYAEQAMSSSEVDELRYYFHSDRVWSLFLTQLIGLCHIVFEYLAFCDEWRFYQGRRNFVGLSVSSVGFSLVRSLIIFLYLHDQQTSWMVLGMMLKDILFSAWKLFNVLRTQGESQVRAVARDERDAADLGGRQMRTQEYDAIAFKWTALCLLPVAAYLAYYSLTTYTHRSWYSWLISSLADSVYVLGFASMVPQIYINYKFRSVAHLPIRSLMYKTFNTFIDDVFAFSVKMPLKHRLMTFRDDVVFVVFIYQWYIYPVDKTRANEFGFQYDNVRGEDIHDGQDVQDGQDGQDGGGARRRRSPRHSPKKSETMKQ